MQVLAQPDLTLKRVAWHPHSIPRARGRALGFLLWVQRRMPAMEELSLHASEASEGMLVLAGLATQLRRIDIAEIG